MTLSDCKILLQRFKAYHAKQYGINRIGVFGSVARGEQREDSDVDIVVDVQKPTLSVMYNIQQELDKIFDCEVDVVRYRNSLRTTFKENIDKDAIYV